jgi:hypothetical protein
MGRCFLFIMFPSLVVLLLLTQGGDVAAKVCPELKSQKDAAIINPPVPVDKHLAASRVVSLLSPARLAYG